MSCLLTGQCVSVILSQSIVRIISLSNNYYTCLRHYRSWMLILNELVDIIIMIIILILFEILKYNLCISRDAKKFSNLLLSRYNRLYNVPVYPMIRVSTFIIIITMPKCYLHCVLSATSPSPHYSIIHY